MAETFSRVLIERYSRRSQSTEAARSCDLSEVSGEVVPSHACPGVRAAGFDASKFGVQAAAKRYVRGNNPSVGTDVLDGPINRYFFSAANIFSLPVVDSSADIFTSLFAPLPDDEVLRVLHPGGILVICAAGAGHLHEMRSILYDVPVPSGGGAAVPDGFAVLGEKMIEYPLELGSREEIDSLFTMTPFYHNAPPEGRARLAAKDSLIVTVQVKCTVAGKPPQADIG